MQPHMCVYTHTYTVLKKYLLNELYFNPFELYRAFIMHFYVTLPDLNITYEWWTLSKGFPILYAAYY